MVNAMKKRVILFQKINSGNPVKEFQRFRKTDVIHKITTIGNQAYSFQRLPSQKKKLIR